MRCVFCGQTKSLDQAIEEGWTPYFFIGEEEKGPACSWCSEQFLQPGKDGEMEVKPEFIGKVNIEY